MNAKTKQIPDEDATLDELLRHARTYHAPIDFADTVMQAIREEASALRPITRPRRPWYFILKTSAVAASLTLCCTVAALMGYGIKSGEMISIDDSVLVEAAFTDLGDIDTIEAVCGIVAGGADALAQDDLSFLTD